MRLTLPTVICCCVFTAVLPLVEGAAGNFSTSLKKRFRVWLQSHMRRDAAGDVNLGHGSQLDGYVRMLPLPSSFEATSRPRRSATGCVLFGCSYHTLLHRLHQIHNTKQKETHAPERHMSPNGYGRRRRALPDGSQPSSESDRKRRSGDADQRVSRHNCTCTEA